MFANFRRKKTKWSACSGISDNTVSLLDFWIWTGGSQPDVVVQRGTGKMSEGHTGSFESVHEDVLSPHFFPVSSLLDGRGGWNSEGCETHGLSASQTSCRCDHLTHFGLLLVRAAQASANMSTVSSDIFRVHSGWRELSISNFRMFPEKQ